MRFNYGKTQIFRPDFRPSREPPPTPLCTPRDTSCATPFYGANYNICTPQIRRNFRRISRCHHAARRDPPKTPDFGGSKFPPKSQSYECENAIFPDFPADPEKWQFSLVCTRVSPGGSGGWTPHETVSFFREILFKICSILDDFSTKLQLPGNFGEISPGWPDNFAPGPTFFVKNAVLECKNA